MEDFFRIQFIPLPEIEIEDELKLLRGRDGDQREGIVIPYLFNGQEHFKLRKLLNDLFRVLGEE